MPELPEVETVMQGLTPFLMSRKITAMDVRSPKLRIPIPKQKLKSLIGASVVGVERRAKYIFIHFNTEKTVIVHLGMTGSFSVYPPQIQAEIDMDRHDHFVLTTDKNVKIIYRDPRRFGMVDVVDTDKISSW